MPGDSHFSLNVIGVVEDFHYQSLHQKIEPLLIGLNNLHRTFIAVRIDPDNVPDTVAFIEATWNKYIPYKPLIPDTRSGGDMRKSAHAPAQAYCSA